MNVYHKRQDRSVSWQTLFWSGYVLYIVKNDLPTKSTCFLAFLVQRIYYMHYLCLLQTDYLNISGWSVS